MLKLQLELFLHYNASYTSCFSFSTGVGGSSQPCGPNRGMTMSFPSLFFTGLGKVHKDDLPINVNHAGLMIVIPSSDMKNQRVKCKEIET
jgi:hypothetical protein